MMVSELNERAVSPLNLFLALPSYTAQRYNAMAMITAKDYHAPFAGVHLAQSRGNSLLCSAFNGLWAQALTMRRTKGITHFALLHDDVVPIERTWLTDLYRVMDRTGAKVLSVVSPMKAHSRAP